MEVRSQSDMSDAYGELTDGGTILLTLQCDKLIACIYLSKIGSKQIPRSVISHNPWEDQDRCLDHDIKMHFLSSLLRLGRLIRSSLSSCIIDCLHLAKLDDKLHYLTERLLQEIDLDRS